MSIINLVDLVRSHLDVTALKHAKAHGYVYEWSVRTFFEDQKRESEQRSRLPLKMAARHVDTIVACGRHRMFFLGHEVVRDFNYGAPLAARMAAEGYKDPDLAKKINVSTRTISRVRSMAKPNKKRGRRDGKPYHGPSLDTVVKIAGVFANGIELVYDANWYWTFVGGPRAPLSPPPPADEGSARVAAILRKLLEDPASRKRVCEEYDVSPTVLDSWVANIGPEIEGAVRRLKESHRDLLRLVNP